MKNYIEMAVSVATILALMIGAFWTWLKFIRHREAYPKVRFDLDVNFVGKQGKQWVVELKAILENKGLVLHKIKAQSFTFNIRYLTAADKIENTKIPSTHNDTYQLMFSNKLLLRNDKGENTWLPSNWEYTFIEGGMQQEYTHVVTIPEEATFLLFHSRFDYADKRLEFHTAEKIVKVPTDEKEIRTENSKKAD